jgi:hypothetical protein
LFGCTTKPVICDTRREVRGVDPGFQVEKIAAGLHCHHHFLERSVARTLAQPVDGAFDLARPADLHRCQGIGDRHAEVVVAVHAPHRLVRVGNPLPQATDELAELLRHGIADRIGDIDGGGAFLDYRLEHAAEEIGIGAAAVLGRKLDVLAGVARKACGKLSLLIDLLGGHAEFFLHVQRAGGEEHVDARCGGAFQGVDAALDVAVVCAAQPADLRIANRSRDRLHRLEVAVGGGREAGLDHVHPHALQGARDAQLLVLGHGGARALLAVAHGGVEDDEFLLAHGVIPWPASASSDARIVGGGI